MNQSVSERMEYQKQERVRARWNGSELKQTQEKKHRGAIKRILAGAVLVALILPYTAGCAQAQQRSGKAAIEAFLDCISTEDYAGAYALLASSVRNDGEETKEKRVTEQEFVNRYINIFDALEITAVEYKNLSVTSGEILCKATFDGIYSSGIAGEMENSFSLLATREGGEWCIEWSPALIFPEMEWGDTVRVATLSAERGEILSDGSLLAATVGTISVYAAPSKIADMPRFLAQVSPLLGMTQQEIE